MKKNKDKRKFVLIHGRNNKEDFIISFIDKDYPKYYFSNGNGENSAFIPEGIKLEDSNNQDYFINKRGKIYVRTLQYKEVSKNKKKLKKKIELINIVLPANAEKIGILFDSAEDCKLFHAIKMSENDYKSDKKSSSNNEGWYHVDGL